MPKFLVIRCTVNFASRANLFIDFEHVILLVWRFYCLIEALIGSPNGSSPCVVHSNLHNRNILQKGTYCSILKIGIGNYRKSKRIKENRIKRKKILLTKTKNPACKGYISSYSSMESSSSSEIMGENSSVSCLICLHRSPKNSGKHAEEKYMHHKGKLFIISSSEKELSFLENQ